jgi:hypothetical protein
MLSERHRSCGNCGRLPGPGYRDDGLAEAAQARRPRGGEADHLWEVIPAMEALLRSFARRLL